MAKHAALRIVFQHTESFRTEPSSTYGTTYFSR